MKKFLPLPLFILVFSAAASAVFGQQPDRWRGLVLDESTPEDAVRILGKPVKDQPNQPLRVFGGVNNWLTKRQKEKIFRVVEFKLGENEGVQKAVLYFLEGKLVRFMLDLKKSEVSPNGLGRIYGIELSPMVGRGDLAMDPEDYERNQGKIYPKSYPIVYYLVGVSERSFVSGMVGNVSVMGILAKSVGGERKLLGQWDGGTVVDVFSVTDLNETKLRFTVEIDGSERCHADFRNEREMKKRFAFDDELEDEKDPSEPTDDDILAP